MVGEFASNREPLARGRDANPGASAVTELLCSHICEFALASLTGVVPCDRVAIATLDSTGSRLSLRAVAARRPDRAIPRNYTGSLSKGSLSGVLAGGFPRIINNLMEYQRTAGSASTELLVRDGYAASLSCPLNYQGRELGMLFFNSDQPDVYHSEHVEAIQRLGGELGRVVQDVLDQRLAEPEVLDLLSAALRTMLELLRSAHQEEALLARVLDLVELGVGLDDVLQRLYESFGAIVPYQRIGFAVFHAERQTVTARWANSSSPLLLGGGFTQPIGAGSLAAVMASQTSRIIDDLGEYLRRHPTSHSTQLVVREGMRSSLTFPLGTPTKPLGFLFFSSQKTHAYTAAHVRRLARLTVPLTAALDKALLLDEVRQAHAASERLLHMLLPASIAKRVQAGEQQIADVVDATVLFADIVGFSTWSGSMQPLEMVKLLEGFFARVDEAATTLGVQHIRTMGDGYLAVSGVPHSRPDHAVAAAHLAHAIVAIAAAMRGPDGAPLQVRVGLHSGPVAAGVMGAFDLHYDVWGPTVSLAARMEQSGEPARVQVSEVSAAAVRGTYHVSPRGPIEVKGIGVVQSWWLGEVRADSDEL